MTQTELMEQENERGRQGVRGALLIAHRKKDRLQLLLQKKTAILIPKKVFEKSK